MNYVLEKTKEEIEKLENKINDPTTCDLRKEDLTKGLTKLKRRLVILEKSEKDLELVREDIKVITSHTQSIEDKYNCRSVKFMFWLSGVVERFISKSLADSINNYTISKIHAPVCSIVSGKKQDLPPMPQHFDPVAGAWEQYRKEQSDEMQKFRNITIDFLESPPTFWEKIQVKCYTILSKVGFRRAKKVVE